MPEQVFSARFEPPEMSRHWAILGTKNGSKIGGNTPWDARDIWPILTLNKFLKGLSGLESVTLGAGGATASSQWHRGGGGVDKRIQKEHQ